MSDVVCQLEHFERTTAATNSWNHNDDEGQDVSFLFTVGMLATTFFILCVIIACQSRNRKLKLLFGLIALGFLTVAIVFFAKFGMHVNEKPISLVYALSHYITKAVRTKPKLNPSDVFPGHVDFEQNFAQIQSEVLKLAENDESWPLTKTTFSGANEGISEVHTDAVTGKEIGWRIFMVSVGDNFSPRAEEVLPTLTSLIKKHKDKMVSCAISMLPPQVRIPPHVGYSKAVIRYMLPIELPVDNEQCFLCTNGVAEHWELGKSFAFDDCFIHSVHNDTSQRRIVIYADILREVAARPWLSFFSKFVFKNIVQNSDAVKKELARTEYLISSSNSPSKSSSNPPFTFHSSSSSSSSRTAHSKDGTI